MRSSISDRDCVRFYWGTEYLGTVNQTEDGKPCDKWNESFLVMIAPHRVTEFGSESYCRNVENFLDTPWCFTDITYFSKCNIPFCSKFFVSKSKLAFAISDPLKCNSLSGFRFYEWFIYLCEFLFAIFYLRLTAFGLRRIALQTHQACLPVHLSVCLHACLSVRHTSPGNIS